MSGIRPEISGRGPGVSEIRGGGDGGDSGDGGGDDDDDDNNDGHDYDDMIGD